MTDHEEYVDEAADAQADELLSKLLYLKEFEKPAPERMLKSRQEIMRRVRQSEGKGRQTLGDLLEMHVPWLFAEPRYGIAALFIAIAALQFVDVRRRHPAKTGIYTSNEAAVPAAVAQLPASTNDVYYPRLPGNVRLFDDPVGDRSVMPVDFVEER